MAIIFAFSSCVKLWCDCWNSVILDHEVRVHLQKCQELLVWDIFLGSEAGLWLPQ